MTGLLKCKTVAVRIEPLESENVERLVALAREIWCAHYPGIISVAQIEYMLARRYAPSGIRADLMRDGIWWDRLMIGAEMGGFSCYFLTGVPGEMKLDKLYVHPRYQRQGHGGRMIARVAANALSRGCQCLTLAVNRTNPAAIAAYLKHGFRVAGSVVQDIGSGFVMDDYIMERSVMSQE